MNSKEFNHIIRQRSCVLEVLKMDLLEATLEDLSSKEQELMERIQDIVEKGEVII